MHAGRAFLTLVILSASLHWLPCAHAGTGGVHTLDGRRDGLLMDFDARWLNGNGYRPIRFRLTTANGAASPDTRTLRIVVRPYQENRPLVTVIGELELPAGSSVAEKIISVPQHCVWTSCRVDVSEGGSPIESMSGTLTGFNTGASPSDWSELLPTILIIDKDAPTWTQRMGGIPGSYQQSTTLPDPSLIDYDMPNRAVSYGGSYVNQADAAIVTVEPPKLATARQNDFMVLTNVNAHPGYEIISTLDVPTNWTELSAADMIFISLSDAQELLSKHPKRWEAIRVWAATGRTLCIYEAGDVNQPADVDQLLGSTEEWRLPDSKRANHGYNNVLAEFNSKLEYGIFNQTAPADAPFRLRPFDLGTVVVFSTEEPFLDQMNFSWMVSSLENSDYKWLRRYGFSRKRDNSSFWNWQIPGVGKPPVLAFLALITAFAVVIGPVNYFWLRLGKRLHLLLVTVPLGGALTTTLLLLYALLADGLHTRVRTRSFVYLNQPQQKSVTWSRQTYYSGMAPSRGLTFPQSAEVHPIEAIPYDRGLQIRNGELNWIGGQSLRRGFLRSREMHQFMVVDAATNAARLDVTPGNPPTVVNELGGHIKSLVVQLEDGEIYMGNEIDVGQEKKLVPLELGNLSQAMREAMLDSMVDVDAVMTTTSTYRYGYGYSYWDDVDGNAVAADMNSSVLERSFNDARSGALLEPRSYIAIVENPKWLSVGVNDARRAKCFDMVFGKW